MAKKSKFKPIVPKTKDLPLPGARKLDPEELDKLLDIALEGSMSASDPPSTVMPDVKIRHQVRSP